MVSPIKKRASYSFEKHSLRNEIVKTLHTRCMLIFICSLVVLECMVVMSGLMVDLHGIRVRFENEEKQIETFVTFMKSKHPDLYTELDGHSLNEVLQFIQKTSMLWEPNGNVNCECPSSHGNRSLVIERSRKNVKRRKRNTGVYPPNINSKSDDFQTRHGKRKQDIGVHQYFSRGIRDSGTVRYRRKIPVVDDRERFNEDIHRKVLDTIEIFKQQRNEPETKQSKYILNVNKEKEATRYTNKDTLTIPTNNSQRNKHGIKQTNADRTHHTRDYNLTDEEFKHLYASFELPNVSVERSRRSVDVSSCVSSPDIFVFSVNTDVEHYYLVTEFIPSRDRNVTRTIPRDIRMLRKEHEKYGKVSAALTYVGFGIFSLMLLEIVVKLCCLGCTFFKKKIDVFDAFIVIISFALDASFLYSEWSETGKGTSTALVLLLPWRLVRIVNNFLSTINHKHHIEIIMFRRAKKKNEIKISRLKELMMALRRDVDLLVNLCKMKGATGPEISACIYGKGRCTATLAAVTNFASVMFISTFGKENPPEDIVIDDLYGNIIRDILDDGEEEETESDQRTESILISKDDGDIEDDIYSGEIYTVTKSLRRAGTRTRAESSNFQNQRRATIPRRHVSFSEEDPVCSYVNDAYVTSDEINRAPAPSSKSKTVVTSMPSLNKGVSTARSSSSDFVTFEVRTQVSYL